MRRAAVIVLRLHHFLLEQIGMRRTVDALRAFEDPVERCQFSRITLPLQANNPRGHFAACRLVESDEATSWTNAVLTLNA
jgi:hypothetical protein